LVNNDAKVDNISSAGNMFFIWTFTFSYRFTCVEVLIKVLEILVLLSGSSIYFLCSLA
jgi:hypothetical protein